MEEGFPTTVQPFAAAQTNLGTTGHRPIAKGSLNRSTIKPANASPCLLLEDLLESYTLSHRYSNVGHHVLVREPRSENVRDRSLGSVAGRGNLRYSTLM